MPWIKQVPAAMQSWYLGSEAGTALAAVLFGDVNPSGKLPFTFPVELEDNAAHALGEFVYESSNDTVDVKYNEGIYVGYRWSDIQGHKSPLFPFGHGLSYTTFEIGKPSLDKDEMSMDEQLTITIPVKNTGNREGAEVVQLYISDLDSSLPRPVKELKGFEKIKLQPGEMKNVTFTIKKEILNFYDDRKQEWVAEPGDFEAVIATSAMDVKHKAVFRLTE